MRKTRLTAALLLAVCLFLVPLGALAGETDGDCLYTMLDSGGQVVARRAGRMYVGDEYISGDNRLYRVTAVDTAHETAFAEDLGEATIDEAALSAFQSLTARAEATEKPDGKKLICMYSTHSDESYVPDDGDFSLWHGAGIYDVGNALKDELEETEALPTAEEPALRRVTMEQASDYLALRRAAAPRVALATFLCILSPAVLLLLSGMSGDARFAVRGDTAAGIGLCVLLVLVAAAVALFITSGTKSKVYEFLEKEPFETEYGVAGMVKERKQAFAPTATRLNVIGTVLCILSAVPLFIAVCLNGPDLLYVAAVCLLLVLAGVGSALFVYGGVYQAAMDRLLEEGDYVRPRKRQNGVVGAISSIYWLTVTAAYLLWTFGPWWDAQPQDTWILWAVAGVLYGAVMALVRGIRK